MNRGIDKLNAVFAYNGKIPSSHYGNTPIHTATVISVIDTITIIIIIIFVSLAPIKPVTQQVLHKVLSNK